MKNFEYELPEGYTSKMEIDAKDKKIGIIFNVLALVFLILIIIIGVTIYKSVYKEIVFNYKIIYILPFMFTMIIYIILHELVHGLFYKIFTKQKLVFGLSWSCAFCGVPNIYVYRKAAMYTIIAPFVIFTIVFLVPLFFISEFSLFILVLIIFGAHFGGCVGDLYLFVLLLFKFKDKNTLLNDTGPKQNIFMR